MNRVDCPQCQGYGDIQTCRGKMLCPLCEGVETVSEEVADSYRQEQRDIAADRQRTQMQDKEGRHV